MLVSIDSYTVDTPPMSLPREAYCVDYTVKVENRPAGSLFVRNVQDIANPLNARALANIEEISKLEDNWDEEGSPAPEAHVKNFAKAIIRFLDGVSQSIFNVAPGPRGEIMIDIRSRKRSAEFLIYPDKAKVVLFDGDKPYGQGPFDANEMSYYLSWLNE